MGGRADGARRGAGGRESDIGGSACGACHGGAPDEPSEKSIASEFNGDVLSS